MSQVFNISIVSFVSNISSLALLHKSAICFNNTFISSVIIVFMPLSQITISIILFFNSSILLVKIILLFLTKKADNIFCYLLNTSLFMLSFALYIIFFEIIQITIIHNPFIITIFFGKLLTYITPI